jgi:hypothetical protein
MQATTIVELSPREQAQAEHALTRIATAVQRRHQPATAHVVEAVFLQDVMRQAADDVDWARHLLGLATAHRWPDFSDTLRRSGVEVN